MRGSRLCLTLWRYKSHICQHRVLLNHLLTRHLASANSQKDASQPDRHDNSSETIGGKGQGFLGSIFNKFMSGSWSKVEETQVSNKLENTEQLTTDSAAETKKIFSKEFIHICEAHALAKHQLSTRKSTLLLVRKIHESLASGASIYDAVTQKEIQVIAEMMQAIRDVLVDNVEDSSARDTNQRPHVKVERETFDNEELLELTKSLLSYRDISQDLYVALQDNITNRLKLKVFSIEQILYIVETLVPIGLEGNKDILQALFEYVAKQEQSIDRTQLLTIIQYFPKEIQTNFIPVVERELVNLRFHELFKFTKHAGKEAVQFEEIWAQLYIEGQLAFEVKPEEIEIIVSDFLSSGHISSGCIDVINKVFFDMCKNDEDCMTLDPKTVCSALLYFTFTERYSEHLLRLSCQHFLENSKEYSPEHVAALVKAIGTVNYQPADEIQRQFFKGVSMFINYNCLFLSSMHHI